MQLNMIFLVINNVFYDFLFGQIREELREVLENEMRVFSVDRELGLNCVVGWNYQEFEVFYNCLFDEIKIGQINVCLYNISQ